MQNKGNQNRAPTQLIMSKFKIADWEDGTSDYYKEDDVVVTEVTAVLKQLRKCLRGKLYHSTISIGRRFQQFFSPEKRTTIYWRPKTSKPAFSYVIKIIVSFFGTAKNSYILTMDNTVAVFGTTILYHGEGHWPKRTTDIVWIRGVGGMTRKSKIWLDDGKRSTDAWLFNCN